MFSEINRNYKEEVAKRDLQESRDSNAAAASAPPGDADASLKEEEEEKEAQQP